MPITEAQKQDLRDFDPALWAHLTAVDFLIDLTYRAVREKRYQLALDGFAILRAIKVAEVEHLRRRANAPYSQG